MEELCDGGNETGGILAGACGGLVDERAIPIGIISHLVSFAPGLLSQRAPS